MFHGKELVGAMGLLAQANNRGVANNQLQGLQIVKGSTRVGRLERERMLRDPGDDRRWRWRRLATADETGAQAYK